MLTLQVVHSDGSLRAAISRNLVVTAWFGAPQVPHVQALRRALQTASGRYAGRQGLLGLALGGVPRFDEPTREALVRVVSDPRLQGLAGAHVIALGGAAGATVRALLSTILLVGRNGTPTKVFGDLAPAAAWLAPLITIPLESWSPPEVMAVTTELTSAALATPARAP